MVTITLVLSFEFHHYCISFIIYDPLADVTWLSYYYVTLCWIRVTMTGHLIYPVCYRSASLVSHSENRLMKNDLSYFGIANLTTMIYFDVHRKIISINQIFSLLVSAVLTLKCDNFPDSGRPPL